MSRPNIKKHHLLELASSATKRSKNEPDPRIDFDSYTADKEEALLSSGAQSNVLEMPGDTATRHIMRYSIIHRPATAIFGPKNINCSLHKADDGNIIACRHYAWHYLLSMQAKHISGDTTTVFSHSYHDASLFKRSTLAKRQFDQQNIAARANFYAHMHADKLGVFLARTKLESRPLYYLIFTLNHALAMIVRRKPYGVRVNVYDPNETYKVHTTLLPDKDHLKTLKLHDCLKPELAADYFKTTNHCTIAFYASPAAAHKHAITASAAVRSYSAPLRSYTDHLNLIKFSMYAIKPGLLNYTVKCLLNGIQSPTTSSEVKTKISETVKSFLSSHTQHQPEYGLISLEQILKLLNPDNELIIANMIKIEPNALTNKKAYDTYKKIIAESKLAKDTKTILLNRLNPPTAPAGATEAKPGSESSTISRHHP